jgi:hypothetical protein
VFDLRATGDVAGVLVASAETSDTVQAEAQAVQQDNEEFLSKCSS